MTRVHRRLIEQGDPRRAVLMLRYFKTGPGEYGEGDRFIGLSVPKIRSAVREFGGLPAAEIERLLHSKWHEERLLALLLLVRRFERGDRETRVAVFGLYLRNTEWINGWDLVDVSAPRIVGAHLIDRDRRVLRRLAKSKLVWDRRIAIMATLFFIHEGEFDDTQQIAELLVSDDHDLIHKAVGWMLREIGKRDRETEERFLRRFAAVMPRTMLRYAIEKFPDALRKRYLGLRAKETHQTHGTSRRRNVPSVP